MIEEDIFRSMNKESQLKLLILQVWNDLEEIRIPWQKKIDESSEPSPEEFDALCEIVANIESKRDLL